MREGEPLKVLLICGTGALTLNIIYGLKMAGVRVHAVGAAESALRWSRHCEAFHSLPIYVAEDDPDAYCAALNGLHAKENFDCVITGAGGALLTALHDKIHIPHFPSPSAHAHALLDDKATFGDVCQTLNVPVPDTRIFEDKEDLEAHFEFESAPVVIKPTNQGFNAGLVFVRQHEDLVEHIFHNEYYRYKPLIVQDYIDGYDIDVSVLARDGELLKSAVQIREGKEIVFVENDALVYQVEKIVNATNYNGLAHFDARIADKDGGLYLIECNPRFWGSMNAALYCGINFVAEGLRLVIGQDVSDDEIEIGARYTSPLTALRKMYDLNFDGFKKDAHMWDGLRQMMRDPLPHLRINGSHVLTRTQSALRSVVSSDR